MSKRKIYGKLLECQEETDGHTVLLVGGRRRVGRSTVFEKICKNE